MRTGRWRLANALAAGLTRTPSRLAPRSRGRLLSSRSACAGPPAARCEVNLRGLLGARASQSRRIAQEAASARMSDSYQATPRVEMRADLGYSPLFTPSYHVLRETGIMRRTSGSFMRRPGECRPMETFVTGQVVTPGGADFICLVSPGDTAIAPFGLLFASHPTPKIRPASRASIRHHPHRPGRPGRMRLLRHRIEFDLGDSTKLTGACLDTWPVWTHLVLAFSSSHPTRRAPQATTLHATSNTRFHGALIDEQPMSRTARCRGSVSASAGACSWVWSAVAVRHRGCTQRVRIVRVLPTKSGVVRRGTDNELTTG